MSLSLPSHPGQGRCVHLWLAPACSPVGPPRPALLGFEGTVWAGTRPPLLSQASAPGAVTRAHVSLSAPSCSLALVYLAESGPQGQTHPQTFPSCKSEAGDPQPTLFSFYAFHLGDRRPSVTVKMELSVAKAQIARF